MACGRRSALAPLGGALLAGAMATVPALAAGHTISTGVVVYDSATFGSDDILVDGATATLQIGGGGVALSNAITLDHGGTLDNAGSISRSGPGVSAETGTVHNHDGGTIEAVDDDGIIFDLGGTVNNDAGSSISGTTGIYSDYLDPDVTQTDVTDSGTITGTADSGVDLENGGTVTNRAGGVVTGANYGVFGWEDVGTTNTGASSLIHGGYIGIALNDGGSVTNADGASVTGDEIGVALFEGGIVTNNGGATITGTGNDGVYLATGGTVTNTGVDSLIFGGWNGVHVAGDTGTVTNTGGATITGGGGISSAAIYLEEGGTVTNGAGSSIVGDSSEGVYGIYASQTTTVSNAGTIVGDVRLADQRENYVTLFTGSHIEGDLYLSTLDDDSTLTLDGDGTQLYSAAVSGQTTFVQGGTLIKTGSGTWIIDSDGVGGGLAPESVLVESGTLEARNNTALTGGTVTVEDTATLAGTGRVGNLVVQSGGIVAPGDSIGTLTVKGTYKPASASSYDAEISGDGTSDLISASGAATIASGAELKAGKYGASPLTIGTTYTVLTASKVTGTYTLIDDGALTAFLKADASYDARHAYLTIVQSRDLVAAASTTNQRATAAGLQSIPADSPLYVAALNLPNDAAAHAAFDDLSGDIHASLRGALLLDAQAPRDVALDRLRTTLGPGAEVWSRGYGALGHVAGDGNAAGVDNRTAGFLFGADLPVGGNGRVGVFGGLGSDTIVGNGSAQTSDFTLGAYGGDRFGPLAVRLGGTVTASQIATDRSVDGGRRPTSAPAMVRPSHRFSAKPAICFRRGRLRWSPLPASGLPPCTPAVLPKPATPV